MQFDSKVVIFLGFCALPTNYLFVAKDGIKQGKAHCSIIPFLGASFRAKITSGPNFVLFYWFIFSSYNPSFLFICSVESESLTHMQLYSERPWK